MSWRLTARAKAVVAKTERGATAVIVAFSMILLMAAGAFGYDIAQLYYQRQQLRNMIDAAAQAGASALPNTADALTLALNYATMNLNAQPGLSATERSSRQIKNTDVSFFCIVRNAVGTAVGGYPDPAQVGASRTCQGRTGWTNDDAKCSDSSCAIPCDVGQKCNSLSIKKAWTVNFVFGPAIDVDSASTGALTTVSCNGPCGGTPPPNPMDVVVMADRTSSMSSQNVTDLSTGIQGMLKTMNPEQQYVAIGTLHKGPGTDTASPTSAQKIPLSTRYDSKSAYALTGSTTTTFRGSWIAAGFSNTYKASPEATTLVSSDKVVKAAANIQRDAGIYGTHLAAALKGSARFLLGYGTGTKSGSTYYRNDSNRQTTAPQAYDPASNIGALPDRTAKYGTPKKVIIFETDGEPNEQFDSSSNAMDYKSNFYDVASTDDQTACQNFLDIATQAKSDDIRVITIATGNATSSTNYCYSSWWGGQKTTRDVLAEAASPVNGVAASASDCSIVNASGVPLENLDGDNFYCASNGTDLQTVFTAAMGSMTGGTKFMSIPGVSN